MSAMGHGCSVTMSSMPRVLQWQNCVSHMPCFMLEERLRRHGQQIRDDHGCEEFRLGCTFFRVTTVRFDVGI